MAAVNWLCLVLAFVFISNNVDTNLTNGNYTTINVNGQTLQQHKSSGSNEPENITQLDDSELSASERTRRLIPYMAFYVPVSELPINKQYANNNMQTSKQVGRPSATGSIGPTASHISIPQQYVHLKVTANSGDSGGEPYLPPPSVGHYHSSAGEVYHTLAYGGQQPPQQQQFHILPTTKQIDNNNGGGGVGGVGGGGNNIYSGHSHHLLSSGPPGPSALATSSAAVGTGNGNNAFVTYKEINPVRHKTVQHFPPLSAASSAPSPSSSSALKYETVRQQQQQQHHHIQQQLQQRKQYGISGGVYRPRTKQSNINLTPFTPSNSVPGDFVPIVYTPLNSVNNNINYNSNSHNNIITSQATSAAAANADTLLNDDDTQFHKQQQQQQIAAEYSAGPLSPASIDAQQTLSLLPPHRHNLHHHQQIQLQHQQHHQHQHHQNPKQQSQYFSATASPLSAANTDLTHEDGASGGTSSGNIPVDAQHHHHQNTQTISPHLSIYHQHQHQQPEHVIIDASLLPSQQPQTLTLIGSKQQQQQQQHHQQQQYRSKPIQYQPPKQESSFESERQHQHEYKEQLEHQHHNIAQVLKDVNSYDTKSSHMTTPQEKYVMYLQHQMRYNKHQQEHTTRQKYREPNNKEREQLQYAAKHQHQHQQQQNPQFFVLSSTASPRETVAVTALSPIRPSQNSHFSPNYSQQSRPIYSRPVLGSSQSLHSDDEQIVTIPVHSLFGELDTLQNNHYSQSHASHHAQYPKKIGHSTPQYIDYLIDEPKQSLDDEQNTLHHHQHTQLETLKPTLGPPSHAFILVSTAAPFVHDGHPQENYGSSLRPPYKSKPKIRLQPVLKEEKNVIYPIIRQPNQTERPQAVVAITPTPNAINGNGDSSLTYVYANEEFGQKITATGAVKLKPSNKYETDNQQNYHQQQQQHNIPLQPLAPKQPTPQPVSNEGQHHSLNQQQISEVEMAVEQQQPQPLAPKTLIDDPNELPDIRTSSLAEILHKLQKSNHLPHTLTPDNIDNSIKTLIRILNNLKETQKIVANPPQHHETPTPHVSSPDDYDYPTGSEEEQQQPKQHHAEHPSSNDLSLLSPPPGPNKHPGPSTGRPGIDYPNYAEIPQTSFDCTEQRYKGFFGDPDTNCQVWHYCDLNGGKASFLCPNGTIFSQIALTCDWWFNVKCGTTTQLYVLNERLYKYILPFTPKFPEDYSGPLVDKYLAMKFQEMEEKMRVDKEKVRQQEAEAVTKQEQHQEKSTSENSKDDNHVEETTTEDSDKLLKLSSIPPAHKHESVNSQVSEQSSERNLLIDDEVDDISQRGTADKFDSTTIATKTATTKPEPVSFSLKPIIVSSTIGPDYDEEQLQQHHEDKRRQEQNANNINKTEDNIDFEQNGKQGGIQQKTVKTSSGNHMQITVEKVNVIEIKPDGATGHLIRDMLLKSKKN